MIIILILSFRVGTSKIKKDHPTMSNTKILIIQQCPTLTQNQTLHLLHCNLKEKDVRRKINSKNRIILICQKLGSAGPVQKKIEFQQKN